MKKSHQKFQQPAGGIRISGGGRTSAGVKRKALPSAEVLAMFASIHQSDEFTVANLLADYASVKIKT